jgi:hypothetical protein
MGSITKYRVWCVSENLYVEGWYDEEPQFCPHNNTHTINASLTTVVESLENQALTDKFGKARIHNTQRPPGTTTYFTGASDDPNNINDVGNGQHFAIHHTLGEASPETLYLDFNMVENITWISEGYVTWNGAKNDVISLLSVPRTVTYEAGTNTNYNILGGYLIIPAAGNGTVNITSDLSLANGGLVYFPDNENGQRPTKCFWDADWNRTTNKYENIRPNLLGNGFFNIFSYEVILSKFVNKIIMNGNSSQRFASNDAVQMGSGMRLKSICETVMDDGDHDWYCSFLLTFFREKTV